MLTTLSVFAVLLFLTYFANINGTREIGTFLIYLFFVVIGVPASLVMIIKTAPLLFLFVLIIALANIIFTLIFVKIFKFKLEEFLYILKSNIVAAINAVS